MPLLTPTNRMDAPTYAASQCAEVEVFTHPLEQTGASDMKVTALGIDLAKNVFQIHGIDQHGKVMLKKQLKRAQMAPFFINFAVPGRH